MSDVNIDHDKVLPSDYHTIVGHVGSFSRKKVVDVVGYVVGHVSGLVWEEQLGIKLVMWLVVGF